MATVDISKLAAIITSSPTPVLDALAVQYGVPTCLLDFSKAFLDMLPSSVLGGMFDGIQDGKDQADSLYKDIIHKIFIDTGILEYDTDKGKFVFVSKSSGMGVEENSIAGLEGLHGLGKILGFGAQAWLIGEGIVDSYNEIKNCIDSYKSYEAFKMDLLPWLINSLVSRALMGSPLALLPLWRMPALSTNKIRTL